MDTLFITELSPAFRHPSVFKKFDALPEGESFLLINDHDPIPLFYELEAERGNCFEWNKIENGPDLWKVQIRKNGVKYEETVGEIAAKDIRKAEVFRKNGIEFCCGGKKTLQQACEEKGLDAATIEAELNNIAQISTTTTVHEFNRWNPDFLADYIYNQHHLYYYHEEPVITDLLNKVVARHGAQHVELVALQSLYKELVEELNIHFVKEEKVLFPFIKALVQAKSIGNREVLNSLFSLKEPIEMMEAEHEAAGEILDNIKQLTNNYTVPANGCNSYHFLYDKLNALDADLHQHIHLENNLLFPKALELDKELRN